MANNESVGQKLQNRGPRTGANAPAGAGTNAPQNVKPDQRLMTLMNQMKPELMKALPKHMSPDRMVRLATTAFRNSPKLLQCDPMTFISAVVQASQLGLEPNTPLGEAYLIPYGNSVQFQVGYKGLLALAHRTKMYKRISAHAVYENDLFDFKYGTNTYLEHTPADEPSGEPIKYYAVYELLNGGYDFRVWSRKQVEAHAKKFSQSVQKGWKSPWQSDFDAMAKKTVLKDLLAYAPKSIEFAKAFESDESIKKEIREDMSEVMDLKYEIIEDSESLTGNDMPLNEEQQS